ncbi:hypothetical protein PINS_up007120, partial [Pythium insidiosum]
MPSRRRIDSLFRWFSDGGAICPTTAIQGRTPGRRSPVRRPREQHTAMLIIHLRYMYHDSIVPCAARGTTHVNLPVARAQDVSAARHSVDHLNPSCPWVYGWPMARHVARRHVDPRADERKKEREGGREEREKLM